MFPELKVSISVSGLCTIKLCGDKYGRVMVVGGH